jgi:hypothetical protein
MDTGIQSLAYDVRSRVPGEAPDDEVRSFGNRGEEEVRRHMSLHKNGSRRRRSFYLELLEDRNLLSTAGLAQPVAEVQSSSHIVSVPMKGTMKGIAQIVGTSATEGGFDALIRTEGSGHLRLLGDSTLDTSQLSHILVDQNGVPTSASAKSIVIPPSLHEATLTAANGDQLFFHYEGTSANDGTGTFNGTLVITILGGTGRFEGDSGGGTAVFSHTLPDKTGQYPFEVTFDLSLKRG